MSAACTTTPSSRPCGSTATWRLRPFSRLAASQPRGPLFRHLDALGVDNGRGGTGLPSFALRQPNQQTLSKRVVRAPPLNAKDFESAPAQRFRKCVSTQPKWAKLTYTAQTSARIKMEETMRYLVFATLLIAVTLGQAGISSEAWACPTGYRPCGSACCPG